jgi:hypothetical protein
MKTSEPDGLLILGLRSWWKKRTFEKAELISFCCSKNTGLKKIALIRIIYCETALFESKDMSCTYRYFDEDTYLQKQWSGNTVPALHNRIKGKLANKLR